MQGESNWVVNGIITIALIILFIPLASRIVSEGLTIYLYMMVVGYVIFTVFAGEAIKPPRPK